MKSKYHNYNKCKNIEIDKILRDFWLPNEDFPIILNHINTSDIMAIPMIAFPWIRFYRHQAGDPGIAQVGMT